MNRRPGMGARRPRAGCALRPRQAGCRTTPANPAARKALMFWPQHQLSSMLGLSQRVFSGLSGSYKFHSQGVRDSVRG
jgi:hypothetical protein